MSEIVTNLHDMNKMMINQLPAITEDKKLSLRKALVNMLTTDGRYYMLLSNERRDYTVLAFKDEPAANKFADEVMEVLESRGTIKEFDVKAEANAIEIWVDDVFYAIFPYDLGVIEI